MAGNNEERSEEVSTDELAGLGPEEIKALKGDDAGDDDTTDEEDDAGTDDTSDTDGDDAADGNDDDQGSGEDDAEAKAAAEAAAAEAAAAAENKDDSAVKPDLREFQAELAVNPVENYDQKMKDIQTKRDDLAAKLKTGEIDLEDYLPQDRALQTEETDLRIQQSTADNNAHQNLKIAEQRWMWQQEQFFEAEKNAIYKDPIIESALNTAVKNLANDPANVNRSGMWFLTEGDRLVRERFNLGKPAADDKGSGDDKSKKDPRKPNLTEVPPTLGNLPAAESSETGADEFAHLDKLSGMDLEQALARLTPEQTDRYLTR
jgi:hypothetical protein